MTGSLIRVGVLAYCIAIWTLAANGLRGFDWSRVAEPGAPLFMLSLFVGASLWGLGAFIRHASAALIDRRGAARGLLVGFLIMCAGGATMVAGAALMAWQEFQRGA